MLNAQVIFSCWLGNKKKKSWQKLPVCDNKHPRKFCRFFCLDGEM